MGITHVQEKQISIDIITKLKEFLTVGFFDCIESDIIHEHLHKQLLYPTDDFHLTEYQFNIVKSMMKPGECLNVFSIGFEEGLFSENNTYYKISGKMGYNEYQELWIDSISVISSDSWQWIVLIDEAFEGGLGLFVARHDVAQKFFNKYHDGIRDVVSFVEYFHKIKSSETSISYMLEILRLCK